MLGHSERVSKAFTKEDDDAPIAAARKRGAPVPVPNFVTAQGLADARAELASCRDPDRVRELGDHLATAEVATVTDRSIVGIGASVTLEDGEGARQTYRIVGAIEADARRGLVSWQSPIATALWGARVGDTVTLPRGEFELVAIDY